MPRIDVLDSFDDVSAQEWDAVVGDGSPFLEHTFLAGLQRFGCAVPDTGWQARPVLIREDDGRLVAAAPAWLKSHSMGEFVYDHSWANAAMGAGIDYYPKLIVAAPFSPVTGQRLLVHPDEPQPDLRRRQLLAGLSQLCQHEAHGLHLLFNPEEESDWLVERGLFQRLQYQFQWNNRDYSSFDQWLEHAFRSKQRKNIRRERRAVAQHVEVTVEEHPTPEIVDALHRFYSNTCSQFGPWGRVYLSRDFFRYLAADWGHRLVAVVARRAGSIVGGAFTIRKGDRMYGRYWGCDDQIRFLHFEVCYYTPVEWCIQQGIQVFEPGHGGGHKYRRGFEPVLTRSNHLLVEPRLQQALRGHAEEEARYVRNEAMVLKKKQQT